MEEANVYLQKKQNLFYAYILAGLFFLFIMSYSFSSSLLDFVHLITSNSIIVITLYCFFFYLYYFIFTAGINIYDEFVLRPKYLKKNISLKSWLDKTLRKEAVIFCFFLFFSQVAYYFLESDTTTWWIPTALIFFLVFLFIDNFFRRYAKIVLYRKIILSDAAKKEYLRGLAEKIGFTLDEVVFLRDDKLKPQAMLVGFEPGRKLFINGCSASYAKEEIGVIFAREAAYHYFGYIWKIALMQAVGFFLGFYLVSILLPLAADIFKFEFLFYVSTIPVILLLIVIVFAAIFFILKEVKKNIYNNVDLFVLKLTQAPDAFISLLIREAELVSLADNFLPRFLNAYPQDKKRINIAQDYAQSILLHQKKKR